MKTDDFETKIESSKAILEKLQAPDISLVESMRLYKEGLKELGDASKMLEKAKLEFEVLQKEESDDER